MRRLEGHLRWVVAWWVRCPSRLHFHESFESGSKYSPAPRPLPLYSILGLARANWYIQVLSMGPSLH